MAIALVSLAILVALFGFGAIYVLQSNGRMVTTSTTTSEGFGPTSTAVYLSLHTVQFVQEIVKTQLVVPDPSKLGEGFSVVGVRINQAPTLMNYTSSDGSIKQISEWSVTLFLWNEPFTNGTSSLAIFQSGGIAIVESPAPPGGNSSASAESLIAPSTICQTGSNGTSCSTAASADQPYVYKSNGLSIVVSPRTNQFTWLDDRRDVWVNIAGEQATSAQLEALVGTMTQAQGTI
jgi:hypothetical protein